MTSRHCAGSWPSQRCSPKAIALGANEEVLAGEGAIVEGRIGDLVVHDDGHQWQAFDPGEVEAFVAGAGGHGPVAEVTTPTSPSMPRRRRERSIADRRDHGAEVADHRQQTLVDVAAVDVAVTATHLAGALADADAEDLLDLFAEGNRPARSRIKGA